MPTTVIRRATAADVDTLVALQARASLAGLAHIFPPERFPFPTEAVRDRWLAALADAAVEAFLASAPTPCARSAPSPASAPSAAGAAGSTASSEPATTVPAGLVAVRPGWLDALYVDPAHWGSGLAVELHTHAIRTLRAQKGALAELWVLEDNQRARSFYERLGWVPNGKTRPVPFPPHPVDVGYTLALDGAGPL